MTYKSSINPGSRTFYLSVNGNDIQSGLSLETTVKTIGNAIEKVNGVNPIAANPTAIIGTGAGIYLTGDVEIPEGCTFVGPGTTFITTGQNGITPGDSALFRPVSVVNVVPNGSAIMLGTSFNVGIIVAGISCRGDNSTGLLLTDSSDTVVLEVGSFI